MRNIIFRPLLYFSIFLVVIVVVVVVVVSKLVDHEDGIEALVFLDSFPNQFHAVGDTHEELARRAINFFFKDCPCRES